VLISRIKPKPAAERELEAAIREFYVSVRRAEPGCLMNAMHRAASPPGGPNADANTAFAVAGAAPTALVFYEVYRDQEAARQHTDTPHFRVLMARIGNLIDGRIELEFLQALDSVDRGDACVGRLVG
jgi:quinol monooxygenase YgiN